MAVSIAPVIERSLWLADLLLCVVLSARLFFLKLGFTYPFFLSYLVFSTLRAVVTWPLDIHSNLYISIWRWTQPVTWVFYTLVILELCSLIFKEYQGIQLLGRRAIYGSLAASVLVSLIILAPTWRHSHEPVYSVLRFLIIEQGIDFPLVLILMLLLAFLALLPIPLSRNVVIHSVLYAAYFMSSSIGIFILNMTSLETYRFISTCLMGVSFLCLLSWIV